MRVRSLIPHTDAAGQVHAEGAVYELPDGSLELALRRKDGIVLALPPDPAPSAPFAVASAQVVLETAPPSDPEE